ncbi:flavin reductase family protein [Pseudonocardia nigra]|uniref:flavin reductase family protein n=1 Tax=Pseudonocardia nigra TaxID=1921578 RepID=UPI001C6076BE|nr:flavin reductase family protein [Pseudonocardia nigra]
MPPSDTATAPPSPGAVAADLRTAFRSHPTGVAVITATDGRGVPAGLTASSVASVSLEPPAIVFSIAPGSAAPAVLGAASFLVHLLDSGNAALARRFATPGADRFGPATLWSRLPTGELLLERVPWIMGRGRGARS